MRFSRANVRITIEKNTETSTDGFVSSGWSNLTDVWAERQNLRGKENELAGQRLAEAETMFTIRYSSDVAAVDATHRVKQGSETFDIVEAIPVPGGKPDRIELYTKRAT